MKDKTKNFISLRAVRKKISNNTTAKLFINLSNNYLFYNIKLSMCDHA